LHLLVSLVNVHIESSKNMEKPSTHNHSHIQAIKSSMMVMILSKTTNGIR